VVAWDIRSLDLQGEIHWRFLKVLYDLTDGDPDYGVETIRVCERADILPTDEDGYRVSRELRNVGLINESGQLGSVVNLTRRGKQAVEENR
jgi:hypothetical protein